MNENSRDELLTKMAVITKWLYMQTRPKIEELKLQLLKTPQQRKAYEALDGEKTIKELAQASNYSSTSTLEELLPDWERKGLILSQGKGKAKKYINLENLEV